MNFREKIEQEIVAAARAKDKLRLSALRLIKNGLHNREIDLHREMKEAEFLQMVAGMVKQRKDSIEQFAKGGRTDLVEKEEAELKVVLEFMPAQMSEEDVDAEIAKAIEETGATGPKDMGKVMKILMPKLAGKADGKIAGDKVKAKLSS
jgi:uncharacterized protein YqeY